VGVGGKPKLIMDAYAPRMYKIYFKKYKKKEKI
jgi:hypothetical protein